MNIEQFKERLLKSGKDLITPANMSDEELASIQQLDETEPTFILEIAVVMQILRNNSNQIELSENETQQLADRYMLHVENEVRRRESGVLGASASFEDLFNRSTVKPTLAN